MGYVDVIYYTDEFKGTMSITEALLDRASEVIDQLTYYRITGRGGIESLTSFQQNLVKKAVCTQAEHHLTMSEYPEGVSSYSINGASVTFSSSRMYSNDAKALLLASGLRYGGLK